MNRLLLLALGCVVTCALSAQTQHTHAFGRAIRFPDIPGYRTLKCDFHIHSVFSDGSVWPDIRVQEALRDSLDAISLTEHLEYQPHSADIPHPDRNRAYQLAEQSARPYEQLLVINGAEITRRMPPGHVNAIFIDDANQLLISDSIEVFREAKRQGAFTFWNHPNWVAHRRDGVATMTDMHQYLIAEGLLHGIEVVNDLTYSDEALQIALDYNLTIMGTSDVHGLVDWQYKIGEGGHRPLTLIFATEKSPEAIKAALLDRRTVAYFNHTLIGRDTWLRPLLQAAITIEQATYQGITSVLEVTLRNHSDSPFVLINRSPYTFHASTDIVLIKPNSKMTLEVKTRELLSDITLAFEVLNAVTAPNTHPVIRMTQSVKK
ncbi:MAG TPA: Sb-PDE family phosphodiesterase [Saprospiraceae bacterium]|nr:Sb-PDE family phosphodiesterase [Saprospiraceae bacterium]HMP13522.1 Sb-PDE family phosphodiesterase [Saprospiraceae bacterium]